MASGLGEARSGRFTTESAKFRQDPQRGLPRSGLVQCPLSNMKELIRRLTSIMDLIEPIQDAPEGTAEIGTRSGASPEAGFDGGTVDAGRTSHRMDRAVEREGDKPPFGHLSTDIRTNGGRPGICRPTFGQTAAVQAFVGRHPAQTAAVRTIVGRQSGNQQPRGQLSADVERQRSSLGRCGTG